MKSPNSESTLPAFSPGLHQLANALPAKRSLRGNSELAENFLARLLGRGLKHAAFPRSTCLEALPWPRWVGCQGAGGSLCKSDVAWNTSWLRVAQQKPQLQCV